MRLNLAIAACALATFAGTSVHASNFDGLPAPMASMRRQVQLPPRAYQKPASFMVSTAPSYAIATVCNGLGATQADDACERDGVAYMPNPCDFPQDAYARLLCHESGHIQGWPGSHPESPANHTEESKP